MLIVTASIFAGRFIIFRHIADATLLPCAMLHAAAAYATMMLRLIIFAAALP